MSTPVGSPEPQHDNLEVYRLRDDLARDYNPANGHERMLVTAIAQTWLRLQLAIETEQRFFASRDMVEVLTTKFKEFQAVTRWVGDCNRAWRHALNMLLQAQRRRQREARQVPSSWPILKKRPFQNEAASYTAPEAEAIVPARRE